MSPGNGKWDHIHVEQCTGNSKKDQSQAQVLQNKKTERAFPKEEHSIALC
tara:strand:+ start:924 stop:1073 length:150 start_codon:yes stop_codon:yes gene_type:complete